MIDTKSLERIIPDYLDINNLSDRKTFELHIERYEFSLKHAYGDILDIASGVGYGTQLIAVKSKCAKSITGVDISEQAIRYAKKRYMHPKVKFIKSDANIFDLGIKYDTIISLETIEHVEDPYSLIFHLKHLLKSKGKIIASVPVTPSVDINPHHVNDFSRTSFINMFNDCGFESIDFCLQTQNYNPVSVLFGKEKRTSQIRKGLIYYYLKNPNGFLKRLNSILVDGFSNKYLTMTFILKN